MLYLISTVTDCARDVYKRQLSEHKELNNLTLQFGKDENAGTIQMDAADGINQLGIRMKPYENGEDVYKRQVVR